jgi:hexosaminidase
VVGSVTVAVAAAERRGMGVGTDESYTLSCSARGACRVSANSTVGAARGLESLAHLAHAQRIPLPLEVFDEPRFPYRGLLIDSARHFLPVGSVRRVLDAMSMTKLNVLHWHLSDSTSFPVQSEAFPQLSRLGAYQPSLVYTRENLSALVAHAAQVTAPAPMPD